jgi:hypothetical protein
MACGAIPESFPCLNAEALAVPSSWETPAGSLEFLKDNTISRPPWQEIVDFSYSPSRPQPGDTSCIICTILEHFSPPSSWIDVKADLAEKHRRLPPDPKQEVSMSRWMLAAAAATLICASSSAALANESGALTGGVAGAIGGAVVGGPVGAVVGGVGGAAIGNSMTNHHRYYHHHYAYYPYHHHHYYNPY